MKVFVSACIALTASALIVLFASLYSSNTFDTMNDFLSPLPAAIEENKDEKTSEEILGCLSKASEYWSERYHILSVFISHRETDEIASLLTTLTSAVKADDSGHYASTLAALRERLNKLGESEKLSLKGVL